MGHVDDSGFYTPPEWLNVEDEFEELMREELRKVYFGEGNAKSHNFELQSDWPENFREFMKLEELKDIAASLTKISDDPKSETENKGRYRDDKGNALHGLYAHKKNGLHKQILIHNGISSVEINTPEISDDDDFELLNPDNIRLSRKWSFKDEKGNSVNINKLSFEAVCAKKKPLAVIYYRDQDFLQEQLKEAENAGCCHRILQHRQDKRKAKLILALDGQCSELFDLYKIETILKSYVDKALTSDHFKLNDERASELKKSIEEAVQFLKSKAMSDILIVDEKEIDKESIVAGLLEGLPLNLIASEFLK